MDAYNAVVGEAKVKEIQDADIVICTCTCSCQLTNMMEQTKEQQGTVAEK